MIDFHNHILPNFDDGSKSFQMSMNMFREAERQGITEIVNTIHFQHPRIDNSHFTYNQITSEINNLQNELNKEKIKIKLHLGSELYFYQNLVELINNPIATIGNGKYMLIEFPVIKFPIGYEKILFELQLVGVTPIIAHPERYRQVQNDFQIISEFIDRGYIIQSDAGSILGQFGTRTKNCVINLLKNNLVHILGSDAHNDSKRNFCLKYALDDLKFLDESTKKSLTYLNPKKIIIGEKIEINSTKISKDIFFKKIWKGFKK